MSELSGNTGNPPSNGTDSTLQSPDHSFDWLKNEHTLRDEGAYFGLVEGNTEEKEQAIRQFFDANIQSLRVGIEIDDTAMRAIVAEIEKLKEHIAKLLNDKESWTSLNNLPQHYFFRYLFGFGIYALMLLFNFSLIYETLGQSSRYPLWLSLGVYLFGMLSLVRKMAIVYSDEREIVPKNLSVENRWKIYAEEIGIPVVAALFVVLYGKTPSPAHAALVFLLVIALFLYAGKGFWQSWLHVQEEYGVWQNNRVTRRNRAARVAEIEKEIQQTKMLVEQKQQSMAMLEVSVRTQRVQMTRAEAQKVAAVHYFKSEFDLARSTKRMGIFG